MEKLSCMINDKFNPNLWQQMIFGKRQELLGTGNSDWARLVRLVNATPFGFTKDIKEKKCK